MTLSKLLFAAVIGLATAAQAYITPGDNYGPVNPGQPYQPGPVMPYPNQPMPQNPYTPYQPSQPYGQVFSKEAVLNRVYRNETLPLRRLADIDRNFRGFNVERVLIVTRSGIRPTQTNLQLLMNGYVEAERTVYSEPQVVLMPRGINQIGDEANSLQLRVNGEIYIERVIVELRQGGGYNGGGYSPNPQSYDPYPGREVVVQLQLPSYMTPNAYMDLTYYVDAHRYRGYQITGVEITANARYNAALIDVLVNGGRQGTMSLNRYSQTARINVAGRVVLGQNFGTLTLLPRGDANLSTVRLILRR